MSETHVIVGAALAGAKAAETLREEGFDGRVVLLGAEDERPYERPPLSKDYLRGETDRQGPYVHPREFYEQKDIELRTGLSVTALDLTAREVIIGQERLAFTRLLLAPGAERRRGRRLGAPERARGHADRAARRAARARARARGGGGVRRDPPRPGSRAADRDRGRGDRGRRPRRARPPRGRPDRRLRLRGRRHRRDAADGAG